MGDVELLDQVRRLRSEGKPPKAIARALGVPPSVVASLVRVVAAERDAVAGEPEVAGCWINVGWSLGLAVDQSRGWVDEDEAASEDAIGGLVSVLVARRHRWDKVSVCGYLVDAYCLGVKNVRGPDIKNELDLRRFLPDYFSTYPHGWQDAPIELARHIVFGAVEYARGLGFEPHADFTQAADHLGTWQGPSAITFGKDGKPFFIPGPHDNPREVIKTLERTVGPPPNFHFLAPQAAPPTFADDDYFL
ncbi:helix-turn-helix domain-containing protein [Frankia sp. Cr1]|uniref:helix-turn-helix domain-containing protein n=1 Tax=Frankia sp. Cr1 TaxID=3073931 RepID=UPI002AD3EC00|nr:helix-turn-helix domain-containing protein [Frankia sp. Cr1]